MHKNTLKDLDLSRKHSAIVTESHRITPSNAPEVRSITLSVDNPDFSYREGQHIGVLVPGPHEFGHDNHFRLYTIANSPCIKDCKEVEIELCVRRCFYIDEVSGEEYPGIASNYLCDLATGDKVTFTGPYGELFAIPGDEASNLLMIGSGTGIAPFRAFIQRLHRQHPDWQGHILLFYGARSGAENLYHNDVHNDLDQYYDHKTFRAFEGLSQRPWMSHEDDGLNDVLSQNAEEIWHLVQQPNTHVYLAGLDKTLSNFETVMRNAAGSSARWRWIREEMIEHGRWSELVYE